MQSSSIRAVVLAGGTGTRLWPVSRSLFPKQFATLAGERSLFEQALQRIAGFGFGVPIAVGNEEHRFIIAEQMRKAEIERPLILLEPEGRNTAAAIALAAQLAAATDRDVILLVLPSDHWIGNADELARGVKVAVDAAKAGRIVAFGIRPKSPHTGYGYIRSGATLPSVSGAHSIETFAKSPTPKPLPHGSPKADGGGIVACSCFARRTCWRRSRPSCRRSAGAAAAIAAAERDGDFLRPDKKSFLALPSLPFDIAMMEKTARGAVIPVEFDWTDLGDWHAFQRVLPAYGAGNTLVGDVMAFDTRNAVPRSDGPLVVAIGLDSIVVVATDDAVLVTSRETSQEVHQVVDRLRREGRTEADLHRTAHWPWGSYRSRALNDRFQVKEIVVRPGVQLSLQLHRHRSEHWVIVGGAALVTIGDEERVVHETESVYVPVGTPHRLANPGKIPLRLIEV